MFDQIYQNIRDGFPYDASQKTVPLSEMVGYENAPNVAHKLIVSLESLPWEYELFMRLPSKLSNGLATLVEKHEGSCKLGPTLTLLRAGSDLVETHTLAAASNRGGLLSPRNAPLDVDALYLCSTYRGYVPSLAKTDAMRPTVSDIKTFAGLGIATFFFDPVEEMDSMSALAYALGGGSLDTRQNISIFCSADGRWIFVGKYDLSAEASKLIGKLRVRNPETVPKFDDYSMYHIRLAYKHGAKSKNLRLCAEWLFDSYAAESDLLAFVQATVALEILFGERKYSDVVGIGKLLANRCAYLIGKSYSDRQSIIADFEKIYDVRSAIVHSGKTHMSGEEWRLFNKLRHICGKSILRELELLHRETPTITGERP